jgi:hypothetical protein
LAVPGNEGDVETVIQREGDEIPIRDLSARRKALTAVEQDSIHLTLDCQRRIQRIDRVAGEPSVLHQAVPEAGELPVRRIEDGNDAIDIVIADQLADGAVRCRDRPRNGEGVCPSPAGATLGPRRQELEESGPAQQNDFMDRWSTFPLAVHRCPGKSGCDLVGTASP